MKFLKFVLEATLERGQIYLITFCCCCQLMSDIVKVFAAKANDGSLTFVSNG